MVDNPMWAICERVAEVQVLLDDHSQRVCDEEVFKGEIAFLRRKGV